MLDDDQQNAKIAEIANAMIHDGIPIDEEDESRLARYRDMIKTDCGLDDKESMRLVYEALLYRKMREVKSHDYLEKGSEFGAGFS